PFGETVVSSAPSPTNGVEPLSTRRSSSCGGRVSVCSGAVARTAEREMRRTTELPSRTRLPLIPPSQPKASTRRRDGPAIQPTWRPDGVTRLTPTWRSTVSWAEILSVAWSGENSDGATESEAACAGAATANMVTATRSPSRRIPDRVQRAPGYSCLELLASRAALELVGLVRRRRAPVLNPVVQPDRAARPLPAPAD